MALIQDRIVIIGGTSGIGRAAAQQFALAGAEVVISGRNEEKLRQAVKDIGHGASGRVVDASDPARLKALFSDLGQFDHLVLTLSGGEGAGPLRELDLAKLRAGFEAKFWAHVAAAQSALPFLKNSITLSLRRRPAELCPAHRASPPSTARSTRWCRCWRWS